MRMPGCGRASPMYSLSTPAMMRSSVDLPEPLRPITPILAPGNNDREMSFKISRLGGTTLPTRFIVYMYCAMIDPLVGVPIARRRAVKRPVIIARQGRYITSLQCGLALGVSSLFCCCFFFFLFFLFVFVGCVFFC